MNNSPNPPEHESTGSGLPARIPVAHALRRPMPAAARQNSTPNEQGITPAFVWRVFTGWWKWVVPLGLILAAGAGAIVLMFYVPKYEASALVKIEAETPFIAFQQGALNKDSERYVQTQIELLRGPVVLTPVLGRPEIASIPEIKRSPDPLKYLQKQLTVRQIGKSELYEVSFVSPSSQDAASVANVVVAEYLALQNREERQRSQMVIEVLEKERLERGTKVDQLRKRVVELAKDLTGKDPFGQGVVTDAVAFSPAGSLYQSLTETDVEFEVLKAELQAINNSPMLGEDRAVASGLLELEISNRADVRRLEERGDFIHQQMAEIKSQPRLKKDVTWEEDPQYIQLQEQAKNVEAELKELKELVKRELIALRREERKAEQEALVGAKQQELGLLSKKREMLSAKLAEQMNELKSGGAQSAELEFAKAELEREESVFELIAARKLALQTEQRAPTRVTLMQSASPPHIAIEPIPYKYLLLASLVSLVTPLGLAIAYEFLAKRISTPEQLTNESSLPLLGEVAQFPRQRVATTQAQIAAPQQRQMFVYTESIDSLRTQLMLTEQVGQPGVDKIIAICSAASGEGKSSLAAALTLSIAKASKKPTLLIDADLRSPDVSSFLEVPSQPGIVELLGGEVALEKAIHRVGKTQAYVLPAGVLKGNPHHLIDQAKIEKLLDKLRGSFDTILIDTPPVLSASDSLIYAKAADLVLFSSLADISRAKQVRCAVERLQTTGANLAGVVLSGVSVNRYVYHYGSYGQHE
ncbi:polysaccharide biosynthesis tyrosine autokinase [Bythopirellula goksoeyrii]|uniref:Tyrosine-protein kinase etk n=1 Tax=Bythopirellula goksoeyrii TaxID=1400387 RepID=A0A5B9QEI7_9BACT|nr:polysaccharide biosynthesis tyrosine autokinase [Bythopirellula goksoeyrii]QEG36050.1 Tyrosine-protein kinase etk [Bythopirellula goksoeyrii]